MAYTVEEYFTAIPESEAESEDAVLQEFLFHLNWFKCKGNFSNQKWEIAPSECSSVSLPHLTEY